MCKTLNFSQDHHHMEFEFGEDEAYFRFGKQTTSRYALDFREPFSPIVAAAVAVSSFAKKLVVTWN